MLWNSFRKNKNIPKSIAHAFVNLKSKPKNIMGAKLTHPGIILREEFFKPLGITQLAAAKATGIPQSRLSEIFAGRRAITPDTAVRLGRFFKLDPRNFTNLQAAHDLAEAETAFARDKPRTRIIPYDKLTNPDASDFIDELFRDFGGKGMMTPAVRVRVAKAQASSARSSRSVRRRASFAV